MRRSSFYFARYAETVDDWYNAIVVTAVFLQVRSNILTVFVALLATLRAEYSADQQTIVACPGQEQLAAILASVMHHVRHIELKLD